ncbi:hypothetical protein [Lentzea guizhouensis]|nr:hypothetical protein [Lentzea guizhouensis]
MIEIWHGQLLVPDRTFRLLSSSWCVSLVAAVVVTRTEEQKRQVSALERRLAKREEVTRLDRIVALLEPDDAPVIPFRRHHTPTR